MRQMNLKPLLGILGMVLVISATQVIPEAFAQSMSAGGYYGNSNIIGSSANSNVPNEVTATQAQISTTVWQGADTNTSYFLQEVLALDYPNGWGIEFVGFNSTDAEIDDKWTNAYATPGCTVLYDQSVVSTNDIFGEISQSSGSGCSSITETYTFDDPHGSYGSTISPIYLDLEYYDTTCSDFNGIGNVDFTNGSVDISGTSSTPTYTASYSGSCFSSTAGSGYITVS